jgi:hypothetical protein
MFKNVCAVMLLAPACIGAMSQAQQLDAVTLTSINSRYRVLIDAENRHDLATVRSMVWQSPDMLFVAKTATPAEGNWAGFWGTEVVLRHFKDLYEGVFVMIPDYSRVKTVSLSKNVAETYAPLSISVGYAGQQPVPKRFLMIVMWVRTTTGWMMATDIAVPIPPAPDSHPSSP